MDERELEPQHLSIGSGEISSSEGILCDKCLAISWKPDDVEHHRFGENDYIWDFDHHETFGDLEASCEAGCPVCQTFFSLLTYDGLVSGRGDPLRWRLKYFDGSWYLYFEKHEAGHLGLWPMSEEARRYNPTLTVPTIKGLTPSGLTNDLSALLDESIKPWLEACLCPGAHTTCPNLPRNEEVDYRMPTRLIDVGSEINPTPKLINSADLSQDDKRSAYLILSYQWGKGNDSARTTTTNLGEREDHIKIHNMPKTIRDAMDVTRLMGVRYLWVDAVCIIQADKNLGSQQDDVVKADWEKESMNMAAYYSNALCCIAAASAKDSSEGFLTERQVAKYSYKKWHSPANVFFPSPHAVRRRFRSSLLSRGWCLQEWLLSPRVLHWTSNGLIWQCSHGFFWEGQGGFQGETPEFFRELPFLPKTRHTKDCILDLGFQDKNTEAICQILQCNERDIVGKTWKSLVYQFVRMDLSFSTDRLAAIQGIATKLSERHGFEYFAGLFRSHCVEHLLWRPEVPQTSTKGANAFPTWSWASSPSESKISFGATLSPRETNGAWTSLLKDLQSFPAANDQSSPLHFTNKELRFTAPLVKLSDLELEDAESERDRKSTETGVSSNSWPGQSRYKVGAGSPLWRQLTCCVNVDNLATPQPLTGRAYLLVLRYDHSNKTVYEGLAVQKDDRGFCQRIGMFIMGPPLGEYGESPEDLRNWETKVVII